MLGALQTQKFAKPKSKKECVALPRVAPSGGAEKGGEGEKERVLEVAKEKRSEQKKRKAAQRQNEPLAQMFEGKTEQAEDRMHDSAIQNLNDLLAPYWALCNGQGDRR